MARHIVLEDYNPDWESRYKTEAIQLTEIFRDLLVNIHHIGSTSIPETCAKPVIDVLIEVIDIERVDALNPLMVDFGYEPRGEAGIEQRRFFRKGGDDRSHHVHTFEIGNTHIDRHLNFRDYLNIHPELAKEYCQLKRNLATLYPEDIEKYIDGKTEFIMNIEKRAHEWRKGSNKDSIH